eukprot:COSAG05_NODE_116_length_17986_cov_348.987534_19_plen_50_part_00
MGTAVDLVEDPSTTVLSIGTVLQIGHAGARWVQLYLYLYHWYYYIQLSE